LATGGKNPGKTRKMGEPKRLFGDKGRPQGKEVMGAVNRRGTKQKLRRKFLRQLMGKTETIGVRGRKNGLERKRKRGAPKSTCPVPDRKRGGLVKRAKKKELGIIAPN